MIHGGRERGEQIRSRRNKDADVDTCVVKRKDEIKNEYIRGAIGVANISGKVTERRFGQVRRRPLEQANIPAGR